MCEALEKLMADVIEERVNQKINEARIENIRNIMKAFNISAEQAMDVLQIPQNRRECPKVCVNLQIDVR